MFEEDSSGGGNNDDDDSSDAEYADVDATLEDGEKAFGAKNSLQSQRESIVFLVDCSRTNRHPISKNYFYAREEDDENEERNEDGTRKKDAKVETSSSSSKYNYVQVALNAYRNVLRDRVVSSPEDEIGLVLYNTKNRRGELEFDKIFVLHELAPITAERVGSISNFIDEGEFGEMLFEEQIGSRKEEDEGENAVNHALWTASHMLSRNAKTRRSAYVFTNDDVVFKTKSEDINDTPQKNKKIKSSGGKKTAKEATIARCEEMANAGVRLELFPGPKIGDDGRLVERDGEKEYAFDDFDVSEGSFWREVLRKFRAARKKREKEEMTRRRKIVMQTLKDAGDDEEVQRMLKEEEQAWMERRKKIRNNGGEVSHQDKTIVNNININDELASDEDECFDIVASSKTRVENLEVVSRRKVSRRRPRKTKVWFNDGTFALPFTIVHLVQKTTKPAPKYVDAEDHQDLRTETVYLDKESGEVVAPKKSYLEIGPEKQKVIVKNTEKQATYAASKNFHANACKLGMHCLGFVDTSEVAQRDRLLKGQGKFVRPDETVFGGKEAFSALLTACAERRVSMLCADVYNTKSQVKYVALIPQVENDAYLGVPAGFHVVRVPFRDDLRQPEKTLGNAAQTSATETQIQVAEGLVESLELQEYHPTRISNPELQAHYKALEAIALNKRKVEKISDDTAPPIEQLWKEHGVIAHIRNFSRATYGVEQQDRGGNGDDDEEADDNDGNGIVGRKRKAAKDAAIKTVLQEIHPGFESFVKSAKKGNLSEYTVDKLKTYLDAHNLPKGGNKASIISRIEKHARDYDDGDGEERGAKDDIVAVEEEDRF